MKKLRNVVLLLLLAAAAAGCGGKIGSGLWNRSAASFAPAAAEEFYDRRRNRDAVRRMSELPGVTAAAVLNRGADILVGITAPASEGLSARVDAIVTEEFGGSARSAVAVNGAAASDILELSYYLHEGLSSRVTERRFEQLFERVRSGEGDKIIN